MPTASPVQPARDPTAPDLTILILGTEGAAPIGDLLDRMRGAIAPLGVRHEILLAWPGPGRQNWFPETADLRSVTVSGGYGERFRAAAANARGEYVVVVDEGLGDTGALARLWNARERAGVVIASRYVAGGLADMPFARRVLSRALNAFCRRALSLPIRDLSSTYRLYRRDALLATDLRAREFDVLEEALVQINADGWEIREVPLGYAAGAGRSFGTLAAFGWSFARTFVRMWQLRNSAFSADYDDRAFNSVIPLQRYWQRTRHRLITGFLGAAGSGAAVSRTLDIGCGSSRIIQSLPHAVGLDIQLKKLRRVQRGHGQLVQGTITRLPFRGAAFETLICSQVIEHVPTDLVDWREMNRVLALHGTFIVGTPDYGTRIWPALEWLYGIVHPGGYVQEHINRYTAASLRSTLEAHGFDVVDEAYVGGGELIYKARKVRES